MLLGRLFHSVDAALSNRISRPFTCPQTLINLSPYEGFTKYVAAFGFLSLILRFNGLDGIRESIVL
jgi:hypothetical protein